MRTAIGPSSLIAPRSSPVGDEVGAGAGVPFGLQRPDAVDRVGALDDVDGEAAGAVEADELHDLLKLLEARRLGALADAIAEPRRTLGERLDRRLGRLPRREVRRVGHVVEDRLGRGLHVERLLETHGRLHLAGEPPPTLAPARETRRSPRKPPSRFLGFISANTRSNVLASKMTAQRISAHHVSGSNAMPSTSGTALPSRRATIRPRYGSLS